MDAWSKCHICSHLISATVTISHFTPCHPVDCRFNMYFYVDMFNSSAE